MVEADGGGEGRDADFLVVAVDHVNIRRGHHDGDEAVHLSSQRQVVEGVRVSD